MFGGDVSIGDLQLINDADARMSESVILKTVPEVSMLMLIFYVMLCYVMLCYVMFMLNRRNKIEKRKNSHT